MDGPYRDIGSGFVRLSGLEAPRRAPSTITTVEDVLRELLKNSRDAGASRIFIATSLRSRRYRTIIVLDDGEGIPENHAHSIFEAGVTSRHLDRGSTSGLSLYHIRNASLQTLLTNTNSPTAIKTILDTHEIPERSLQSTSRTSKSNLLATAKTFARENPNLEIRLGSQSSTVAALLKYNIIRKNETSSGPTGFSGIVSGLGFDLSSRTLKRVDGGEIGPAGLVSFRGDHPVGFRGSPGRRISGTGEVGSDKRAIRLSLGDRQRGEISAILREAAAASYLVLGPVRFEISETRISIKADISEPEGDYE